MFMRSMLLHILIALISEKTLEERKRQEAHRTYTDFKSDGTLIESGKIENFKGKRTWLLPERTRTDHYW